MKTLLQTDSPKYLRRLARELNTLTDGFYDGSLRFSRARYSAGVLQGYRPASYLDPSDPRTVNPWRQLDAGRLSDSYGRSVCASRV
jgi:hypothetical protein